MNKLIKEIRTRWQVNLAALCCCVAFGYIERPIAGFMLALVFLGLNWSNVKNNKED